MKIVLNFWGSILIIAWILTIIEFWIHLLPPRIDIYWRCSLVCRVVFDDSFGIIQTLCNAVFGKDLVLPHPLVMVCNVSNMPLPLLRNEIFDTLPLLPLPLLIENTSNNLRYTSKRCLTYNLCDFKAILVMDIVLTRSLRRNSW